MEIVLFGRGMRMVCIFARAASPLPLLQVVPFSFSFVPSASKNTLSLQLEPQCPGCHDVVPPIVVVIIMWCNDDDNDVVTCRKARASGEDVDVLSVKPPPASSL